MIFDLPPQTNLWTPPKPAIIRSADSLAGVDRATFPFPVFCPVASSGIDPNIKMLFHFDGTNGSTTFTDSSSYGKTWSTSGSPSLSTSQFKFGTASLRLASSASVYRSSDSDLGFSGDFIIDGQFRFDSTPNFATLFSTEPNGGGTGFDVYFISNKLKVYDGGAGDIITGSATISTNTWYHIMISRVGSSLRLFVNGTQDGSTATNSTNYNSNIITLGATGGGGSTITGYADEFRVVKGAGQASNFTAPTAPY